MRRREEETFIEEKYTEEGKRAFEGLDNPSRSCLRCKKVDVCVLYRSEISMLQTYFGHLEKKDWPCEPEDRAVKCKLYLPMHWQEIER